MKNKILSSITSLGIGIIFLFVGVNNLWPDFIVGKGEQIAVGFCLTLFGLISLFLQIFEIKKERALYLGIIIGILLVIAGLFLMGDNHSVWAVLLAVGTILFLPNFIELLRRKFPDQEFFNKKPYNEEK